MTEFVTQVLLIVATWVTCCGSPRVNILLKNRTLTWESHLFLGLIQREGRLEAKVSLQKENLINKPTELQDIELNVLVSRRNHISSAEETTSDAHAWTTDFQEAGAFVVAV